MGSVRDHMPDMTDPSTATRVNRALVALCVILALVAGWALATRSRASTTAAPTYWVAADGDDAASGSESAPWATLQHAADAVSPGATVEVRGGTYAQRVSFHVSGTPGAPITFEAAPGESVVLDGSSLEVPSGQAAMIEIDSQRYLTIQGFQITGWGSDESGHVPIGILVTGSADHVRIADNTIHDMGTTFQGRSGGDAHGIGVFGTTPDHPIDGVEIVDNELANLTLGSSEALVVNGNVQNFTIEGNRVHDTNNIGIDVIGFEGTAPDPTVDQARDGVVRGNEVWNVDSYGNPAYGYDRSADGIYVDGGRDVLVEGNVVHDVNIGIEMASEHAGRSTRNITTRNNVVYDATAIGIAIGGYDRKRGSTEDCTIVNNTVVDTKGPELLVQFDTRGNTIANNIFVAGRSHDFVENAYTENVDNVVDANLYYAEDGDPHGTWQWKAHDYGDFATWQARSGVDRHAVWADPGFADPSGHDYHVDGTSPVVDAGLLTATSGSTDLDGTPRAQGASIDIGAYEVAPPPPSPTPSIAEPVTYAGELPFLHTTNGWGDPEVDHSNGERAPDDGGPIRIGTSTFEHGIGAHAPSKIVLDLGGRCSTFLADVGVDEEVGSAGSVVFEVVGDGKVLASSGPVRGSQASVPLVADVTGLSSVSLVVTDAGDGNANDHADWGNARLACSS